MKKLCTALAAGAVASTAAAAPPATFKGIPEVDVSGDAISESSVFPDYLSVGLPERCAALGGSVQ
jgi:hypothetical protein